MYLSKKKKKFLHVADTLSFFIIPFVSINHVFWKLILDL